VRSQEKKMTRPTSTSTTVAILGTDSLAEDILARLLRHEGYNTRIIDAYPTGIVDELLDGVDVLLLAPGLDAGLRRALVEAMKTNPRTAHIHTLSFSEALKQALVDELAVAASWQSLFEELTGEIGSALERAAASARALVVDGGEPAAQAADAP
jgi:hypothetical protein